jgi:NAD(P)-dependent dehydrogenase (short-subunit alcohol dehydrogenase family)
MPSNQAGRVVNISSLGGRLTLPLFGVYNATKYAVESLCDAMRVELLRLGIRVVTVEPASIKTEFANTSVRKIDTSRRADSPYAALYARIDEIKAQANRTAVDPLVISQIIERAVTACSPQARYAAPFIGRVMIALGALLPTWALDWTLARTMGLTRAGLGPAADPPRPATSASSSTVADGDSNVRR